jgi:hypothetical protein
MTKLNQQLLRNTARLAIGLIAAGVLASSASAQNTSTMNNNNNELTLYPSFGEVRTGLSVTADFAWSPSAALAASMVPGSLNLDGPRVLSLTMLAPTGDLLAAFEGQMLQLKQGDKIITVKVLNANQGLFEENGSAFFADPKDVRYPAAGLSFAPLYQWRLAGSGNATLSYLSSGLGWSPRYSLNLSTTPDKAILLAWADVRNNLPQGFMLPSLSLVAGDVMLGGGGYPGANQLRNLNLQMQQLSNSGGEAAPIGQEINGLYTFRFDKAVNLPAQSTTSLPFIAPNITLERAVSWQSDFDSTPRRVLSFNRLYTVRADGPLPTGMVTVREDGQVVGQTNLADTPKGEAARLELGADFDLRLVRTVEVLSRNKDQTRYRVTLTSQNTKGRAVNVRLRERFSEGFVLEKPALPNFRAESDGYISTTTLAAGAKLEASYTVVLRNY